jgi:hypothetical protein
MPLVGATGSFKKVINDASRATIVDNLFSQESSQAIYWRTGLGTTWWRTTSSAAAPGPWSAGPSVILPGEWRAGR